VTTQEQPGNSQVIVRFIQIKIAEAVPIVGILSSLFVAREFSLVGGELKKGKRSGS
jgi:hypothetical protein